MSLTPPFRSPTGSTRTVSTSTTRSSSLILSTRPSDAMPASTGSATLSTSEEKHAVLHPPARESVDPLLQRKLQSQRMLICFFFFFSHTVSRHRQGTQTQPRSSVLHLEEAQHPFTPTIPISAALYMKSRNCTHHFPFSSFQLKKAEQSHSRQILLSLSSSRWSCIMLLLHGSPQRLFRISSRCAGWAGLRF